MSLEKPPPPAAEQENPYYPAGPTPNVFEDFQGIDTSVPRIGVPDQKMSWCDGFMPIKKRNLRTLYGKGAALSNGVGGLTIVFFGFFNIKSTPYCVEFFSDGSVAIGNVNLGPASFVFILPAGTILAPSIAGIGITQYGSQYLIITANQTNGYWIWDGSLIYQAGTLGPVVTLTNVGAGYKTAPIVVATGGSGSGATFVATINNGVVTNVVETNPGSGYLPGQTVTLAFSGGNSGGSGASLTAVLSSTGGGSGATFTLTFSNAGTVNGTWYVSSVAVTNGGSGYSQFTVLNITLTDAHPITYTAAVLQPVVSGGLITGVTIVNRGVYSDSAGSLVPVTGTLSTSDSGNFHVTSVTIGNGGSGYSASATATCSGGGSPIQQATLQLILTSGVITGVTVASGGLYGSNTPPTVTVADAPVNAAATVALMPFGIQGTTVETYAGHVWVANGPVINATAPGSVTDFATSNGGVSFTSSNSNLKVGYTRLLSTNGFLFLIGDSAVDYISGVTTSGTPPTTTYSYLNADPETGTPYPASVLTFGNTPVLANSVGVHQLAGSTFTKVSDDLDGSGIPNGLWNSVANFGGNQLSSAKANIFNHKVWMVLTTIKDPISGSQVNKLFMWDGKAWWAAMQDVTLTFIATSEINSVLTAYGTDGNLIYPLFQTPSTAFAKVVQSRLWDGPGGYTHVKAATRLFGIAYIYANTSPTFTVNIDNENSITNASYTVTPASAGYFEIPPEAVGQQGVMMGLTITTNAADLSLVSVALQEEIVGYRG